MISRGRLILKLLKRFFFLEWRGLLFKNLTYTNSLRGAARAALTYTTGARPSAGTCYKTLIKSWQLVCCWRKVICLADPVPDPGRHRLPDPYEGRGPLLDPNGHSLGFLLPRFHYKLLMQGEVPYHNNEMKSRLTALATVN